MSTTFILSPAKTNGKRAQLLVRPGAAHDLARRLRSDEGASLGEVFSFLSGLYFRGKLAYAERFAAPERTLVITSCFGLLPTSFPTTLGLFESFAREEIHPDNARYTRPLRAACELLAADIEPGSRIVLLGSIASEKYVPLLADVFGEKLLFPKEFVGRGDMSRGGLLLRAARNEEELEYVPVSADVTRRGSRPPRLSPLSRSNTGGARR